MSLGVIIRYCFCKFITRGLLTVCVPFFLFLNHSTPSSEKNSFPIVPYLVCNADSGNIFSVSSHLQVDFSWTAQLLLSYSFPFSSLLICIMILASPNHPFHSDESRFSFFMQDSAWFNSDSNALTRDIFSVCYFSRIQILSNAFNNSADVFGLYRDSPNLRLKSKELPGAGAWSTEETLKVLRVTIGKTDSVRTWPSHIKRKKLKQGGHSKRLRNNMVKMVPKVHINNA